MDIRFLGNIEAKVDTKSRIFVPVAFRRLLLASDETVLVLRKDLFQDCLILYPLSVWELEVAQLRSRLSRWDKYEQHLFRQFVTDAERLEMDANGRVLVSRRCLDMVGIESEVRFVGVDNTIELWASDVLDKTFLSPEDFSAQLEQLMNNEK